MRTLLIYLPAVVCGAMMLACAWMMFGHRTEKDETGADDARAWEMAELLEEVARLRADRALHEREESSDG